MAPHFTIYKSEMGVRMENEQLTAENKKLVAEIIRLKQMVGEPVTEKELAKVTAPAPGEAQKSGNCTFSIMPAGGAKAATPVVMNPAIARARGKLQQPADLPASTQPADVETQEQQDQASTRFGLIELR